ncbi:AMP-binding protein [Hoeflea marina]|uniref:AMP-binding protein n=1 Tax=Hoeflea marina TaxID=274592 RepID=UPI001AEC8AFD|nr:AMP-binding protein [Hoeflea marina]
MTIQQSGEKATETGSPAVWDEVIRDEVMADGAMQHFGLTLDKFLDHAAHWHPDAEVVSANLDGTISRAGYGAIRARALEVSGLLAGLGVTVGSRVATLAWNGQAHFEAWYGIMGLGATCHTLNPRLTAEQSGAMLRQSGAAILIVSADLLPLAGKIADHAPALSRVYVIDRGAGGSTAMRPGVTVERLAPGGGDPANPVVWGEFDETTASGLCFTSGTTGAPKGVTYTHRSSYLHTLRLLQADVLGITAADSILAVVPMFHASAWGLPFAAPAVGARLVLPGRQADGASLARLIASEGVTLGVGVPTVWLGLVEHLEQNGGELPSLKRILVGGAPLPPALMQRIEQRLGVTVQTSWGMTELSPSGTMAVPGDPARRASVSGRPAVGVDLQLCDPGGNPLPGQRGVEGHLHVRGAAVIERYLGDAGPAVNAAGWFDTGDLARIDEAGNLIITGRAKDLIKSGGEWINPAEIEAVIGALPEVSLAAVIARPDAKWGEQPVLLVEVRAGQEISDEELLASLQGRVASWWIPRTVIRTKMPMASTGKIDKMRLKADYGHA